MRTSIKDIARIAGVSVSTVSFALNNKPGVSDATRLKIQSVAEKLNYKPSNIARSLVTKKTRSVGLIIPDISEVFYGTLAKIIQDALNEDGYRLILCNSESNPEKEASCLDLLTESGADGIIMVPCSINNAEKILNIMLPTVFLDSFIEGMNVSHVGIDNEKAGYRVTEILIGLGHSRIACIAGPAGFSSSNARIRGYQRALKGSRISANDLYIKYTDWTVEGGFRATKELICLKDTPTAIFVTGDTCAIGVFEALFKSGLHVPGDIAVIGFDDMKFSSFLKVPLTTVRQPMRDMGTEAVLLLLKQIAAGEGAGRKETILDTEIVIRESCGSKNKKNLLV
jgi:DNA-binding LacI/PurR family transcriptional regulator